MLINLARLLLDRNNADEAIEYAIEAVALSRKATTKVDAGGTL